MGNVPFICFYDSMRQAVRKWDSEGGRRNMVVLHASSPLAHMHAVRSDFRKGFSLVTRHLISKGHKRIGLVTGPVSNEWYLPRFDGYMDALKADGVPLDLDLVMELKQGLEEKEVIRGMEELLARSVSAMACVTDTSALQILEHCRKKGIKAPEELAVAGFDNIYEGSLSSPSLTSLDPLLGKIGEAGVDLALKLPLEETDGKTQDVVIRPELIVREST